MEVTILSHDLENKMTVLVAEEEKLLKDTEGLKVRLLESMQAQNDLRKTLRNNLTPIDLEGKSPFNKDLSSNLRMLAISGANAI